jgi:hypothetical protein
MYQMSHPYRITDISASTWMRTGPPKSPRASQGRQTGNALKDSKSSFEVTNIGDSAELDRAADKLTAAILTAYEACCPVVHRKVKRDVSWWGKGLQEQKKEARRLQNKKKVNRVEFKRAITAYSKEIRRLKRKFFVRFTDEIIDTPVASRLIKVLCKEHSYGLETLIKADRSRMGVC